MDLWRPVFVGVAFEKQQAKALVKEVGKKGAPRQVTGGRVVRTSEPLPLNPSKGGEGCWTSGLLLPHSATELRLFFFLCHQNLLLFYFFVFALL